MMTVCTIGFGPDRGGVLPGNFQSWTLFVLYATVARGFTASSWSDRACPGKRHAVGVRQDMGISRMPD